MLKIFTSEFYSIGALFAAYGAGIMFTSFYRRRHGNRSFFRELDERGSRIVKFRTSGNVVSVLTGLSLVAYISLLVLTVRLGI